MKKISGLEVYHAQRRNFVDPVNKNSNLPLVGEIQKNRTHKDLTDFIVGETHLLAGFTGNEVSKKVERATAGSKKKFVQRKVLIVCDETREVGKALMVKRIK